MQCTTIGVDVAKNIFQVHGVSAVTLNPSRVESFAERRCCRSSRGWRLA